MAAASTEPPVGGHARRRAQTRSRLLDAARTMIARQGIDATRINEITDEAEVGFGTFYNHFESKDAILAAVVEEAVRDLGAAIVDVTTEVADPAEVVAIAHRTILARAVADPGFGWLLIHLEVSHALATTAIGPYAASDLQRGIDSGRFRVDDPAVALVATGGALLGVVRAVLQGHADADSGPAHAAGVLRILGLSPADAAEVAARPLPAVA